MKSLKEILVSVTFIIILVLPFADSIFHFIPEEKNLENRTLKTFPETNICSIYTFPKAFDEYFSDNFDLRNQFLLFNSKIKFQLFSIPPITDKAFMGRNGWMFSIKDEMGIYLENNRANKDELEKYYKIFNYRKNFLDSIGCKYYVVIAPSKTSAYPEFIPLSKRKSVKQTLTDQIVNLLDTVQNLTLIDLRRVIKKAKNSGIRMYHKTDNHWNDYGSYIAYKAIMDSISIDFPNLTPNPISNFDIKYTKVNGMKLTNLMGIYNGVYEEKITLTPTFIQKSKLGEKHNYPVVSGFPYTSNYEIVYTTANDSLPKLLLIRDSFGKSLIPMLSEHFNKSVYIFDGWHHWLNEKIVLNEKPDIFIQLVFESYIPNINKHAKKP